MAFNRKPQKPQKRHTPIRLSAMPGTITNRREVADRSASINTDAAISSAARGSTRLSQSSRKIALSEANKALSHNETIKKRLGIKKPKPKASRKK